MFNTSGSAGGQFFRKRADRHDEERRARHLQPVAYRLFRNYAYNLDDQKEARLNKLSER